MKRMHQKKKVPTSFRPLLWWSKWSAVDIDKSKQDIIMGAINEGTLDQWKWIRKTYGDHVIRSVLRKRLASEFHPESRNLARVVFGIKNFQHARRSPYAKGA